VPPGGLPLSGSKEGGNERGGKGDSDWGNGGEETKPYPSYLLKVTEGGEEKVKKRAAKMRTGVCLF